MYVACNYVKSKPRVAEWIAVAALAILLLFSPSMAAFSEDVELVMYAAGYTPEITSGDNPQPLHAFTEIAKEWEALHPGVRIRFLKLPMGNYLTWMITQLKGGMAPDIMWVEGNWCIENSENNWFIKLNDYLEKPNPYVPGNTRWMSLFYEYWVQSKAAPDGSMYVLPVDLNETAMFYNKDIFEKVGVTPPETWAELIAISQKIKDAGYIPFTIAADQYGPLSWAKWVFHDQLWRDKYDAMNVAPNGLPKIDDQEMFRAYKKGLWTPNDPRFREMLRLLKEWTEYWNKDALAGSTENTERLFRTGHSAMFYNGGWYMPKLLRDPLRSFELGVFNVPGLTKASSPYGLEHAEVAPGVGGAGATQYAITTDAARRGHLELAVDFLQFFTAPKRLEKVIAEAKITVPNSPNMAIEPILQPFAEALKVKRCWNMGVFNSKEYGEVEFRIMQSYFGGVYSLDEAVARINKALSKGMDDLIAHNPQWSFDANWDILPDKTVLVAPPSADAAYRVYIPWLLPVVVIIMVLLAAARGGAEGWRLLWRKKGVYLFIAPSLSFIMIFSYYPIVSAFLYSFYDVKGSGASKWIGIKNFIELAQDKVLMESTYNLLKLLIVGMFLSIAAPFLAAELIFNLKNKRAQYIYRILFVVPMVVPGIVLLLIWQFVFDYNVGLFNQLLRAVGMEGWVQAWLADPNIALYSFMLIGFPWVGGFALLILTAGLQSIPLDVLDACRLDGATGLKRILNIDIPLLVSQIRILVVLGIIGGIQGFQAQLLLTQGGPGYSTTVPGLVLYQNSMLYDRMGYACAIGVALFVVILILTYINMKFLHSSTEYGMD